MIDLGSDDVADYYKVTAYNSTVTVDGEGKVMAHYRKRFLWYADEVWAQEGGEGFETAELEFPVRDSNPPSTHHLSSTVTTSDHRSTDEEEEPDPQSSSALPLPPSRTTKHKTTFAICMDLNTHHFSPSPPSPSSPLEVTHPLAAHILSSRTTLLVLSTAWLTNLPTTALRSDPQEPDWDTVKFWVERLSPLLSPQESPGEKGEREIICVFANRCGEEDGKLRYDEPGEWEAGEGVRYAGSSWIGKIAVGKGEVFMGGVLGRGEEGVCGFDSEGMGGKRGWRLRLREG